MAATSAAPEILSPSILRVVQTASRAAEHLQSAAQQVSEAAQLRVVAEVNQFKAEAAKTEEWRAEEERRKGRSGQPAPEAAEA